MTSVSRKTHASAGLMSAALAGMGVLHFVKPRPFDSLIPRILPGPPRAYTYASGVAELATAALLAAPQTRRVGARGASLLFVAVFPANLEMARRWRHKPWQLQCISLGRLPLQALLIRASERIHRNA